jgi:hypothetical protein
MVSRARHHVYTRTKGRKGIGREERDMVLKKPPIESVVSLCTVVFRWHGKYGQGGQSFSSHDDPRKIRT